MVTNGAKHILGRRDRVCRPMKRFSYTLTRKQVIAAQRFYVRRSLSRPLGVLLWVAIAVVLRRYFSDVPFAEWYSSPLRIAIDAIIPLLLWLVAYAVLPPIVGWCTGVSQYRNQPGLRRPTDVEFTDEGLVWRSGADRWMSNWSEYVSFTENSEMALLYLSPRLFHVFPKSEVTASALDEAKARIQQAKG